MAFRHYNVVWHGILFYYYVFLECLFSNFLLSVFLYCVDSEDEEQHED